MASLAVGDGCGAGSGRDAGSYWPTQLAESSGRMSSTSAVLAVAASLCAGSHGAGTAGGSGSGGSHWVAPVGEV